MARDEARTGSGVDILAVLDAPEDASHVEEALRDVAYDVMLDRGVAVSVHAVTADRLDARADHPFFETVLSEARPIYAPAGRRPPGWTGTSGVPGAGRSLRAR